MLSTHARRALLGIALMGCTESPELLDRTYGDTSSHDGTRGFASPDESTDAPVQLLDSASDGATGLPVPPGDAGPSRDLDEAPSDHVDDGMSGAGDPRVDDTRDAAASDPTGAQPDAGTMAVPPIAEPMLLPCGEEGGSWCEGTLACIDGVCTESARCAPEDDCALRCTSETCAMDCSGANTCEVECGASSLCRVSCVGTNNCEPRCSHGECEIDCVGANNCDHLRCADDASCMARCDSDSNCEFEKCAAPSRCPGNVIVCNRSCPED